MLGAGLVILGEVGKGRPLQVAWFHRTAIVLGALIIIASFCKDYPQTMAGELPNRFNWLIFGAGELIGILAFAHALARGRAAGATRAV